MVFCMPEYFVCMYMDILYIWFAQPMLDTWHINEAVLYPCLMCKYCGRCFTIIDNIINVIIIKRTCACLCVCVFVYGTREWKDEWLCRCKNIYTMENDEWMDNAFFVCQFYMWYFFGLGLQRHGCVICIDGGRWMSSRMMPGSNMPSYYKIVCWT